MVARVLVLLTCLAITQAGCSTDWAKSQYDEYRQRSGRLDTETIVAGLREALGKGTERGVAVLGRVDGYLKNPSVRIPVPDKLQKAETLVRKLGGDRYADEFVLSLNRAAEAAVPQARAIFLDVIRGMTIADARSILGGPEDGATQYFRRHAEPRLASAFRPVVTRATASVGLTRSYKGFVDRVARSGLVDTAELDLDAYVTRKAMDGLFRMIAEEERRIRRDPLARTTELLRKVFG